MNESAWNTNSPTRALPKPKGLCGVCFEERKLHHKNGMVHRHGPRDNPCSGSNKPPMMGPCLPPQPATAPDGTQLDTPGPPLADPGSPHMPELIPHPYLQNKLIKHIPKAARHGLCGLLTSVIDRILLEPDSPLLWQQLLSFGALTLTQPTRGGRRHNLTSKIKARTNEFFTKVPLETPALFTPRENPCLEGKGVLTAHRRSPQRLQPN